MRIVLDVVQGRAAPEEIELDLPSIAEAREHAARLGYTVLGARASGLSRWRRAGATGPERHPTDVAVLVEQLRDLIAAGLSVMEALSTLQAAGGRGEQRTVAALLERLRNGERLSAALQADRQFPALLVALVRAAELTSDLPQALTRYIEHDRRRRALRGRIVSVAIYPSLLMGVGCAVLLFLLLHVMPRFARVFEGMGGDLPWSARAMVAWSQLLGGQGAWLLVACGALAVGAGAAATSGRGRAALIGRLSALGPLRRPLRLYTLARWYRATGMLVEGGIPLPEALPLTHELLPPGLRAGGERAERAVRDGLGPADAYVQAGMATPVAEQLMRAGERTGDLGGVLTRVALFHETEVERSLEQGVKALEPIVMLLIGLGVGTVVVLMYLPIFELASVIQ